ncbi:MAG: thiamine-phosphate kinase [Chloroflexi bacterium]|nr:thiamine-phosphate kinase [Chloroflexota bacterium]
MTGGTVGELGELGLIARIKARLPESAPGILVGPGDDAAVMERRRGEELAITTDALVDGVHFDRSFVPLDAVGYRALAVNLSDIAAMGGFAKYALVSLALPGQTEVEAIVALYQGMLALARRFEVAIVGGNMSQAPLLVINITVLGSTKGRDKNILTRSAAKPGEQVAVTGYLGAAAAGLAVLRQHLPLESKAAASLKQAFLQPYPRVAEGQVLVEHGVRAAIDISDGLISDLSHLCKASQVGARIEIDRLPIPPAVRANFGDRALELALSGGDDYELLFTASAEVIDRVKAAASCPITVIGEIMPDKAGEITLIDGKGNPVNLPKAGWEHFTAKRS